MAQEVERHYYTITEVAQMLEVTAVTLRHWESIFTWIKPKKNQKGNRHNTQKDIEQLSLVHHLVKEKGFTLQGAKEHLQNRQHLSPAKTEILQKLENLKSFLLRLREQIAQAS
jgi:DNA-binding transcriptional MerR regulator